MSDSVKRWIPNIRDESILVCPECLLGIPLDTILLSDCNRRSDERQWGGLVFDSIEINYCPRCGQALKYRDEPSDFDDALDF